VGNHTNSDKKEPIMKRALLAAVAAIALTASASAAPRPLDTVVCDITDNKNNALRYVFVEDFNTPVAIEAVMFSNGKRFQAVNVNDSPAWSFGANEADKTFILTSRKDPDYAIAYYTATGKNPSAASLFHGKVVVGSGKCVLAPDDSRPAPTPAPSRPATGAQFAVPLVVQGGGFSTPVGLGTGYYSMTIDTGATYGLLTESVATALLSQGSAREVERGTSINAQGVEIKERRIVVSDVTLNGHTVHDVMFGVGSDTGGMLFGIVPLSRFGKFTIDAQNSQMMFN
jgi:Aspartyl protease